MALKLGHIHDMRTKVKEICSHFEEAIKCKPQYFKYSAAA